MKRLSQATDGAIWTPNNDNYNELKYIKYI